MLNKLWGLIFSFNNGLDISLLLFLLANKSYFISHIRFINIHCHIYWCGKPEYAQTITNIPQVTDKICVRVHRDRSGNRTYHCSRDIVLLVFIHFLTNVSYFLATRLRGCKRLDRYYELTAEIIRQWQVSVWKPVHLRQVSRQEPSSVLLCLWQVSRLEPSSVLLWFEVGIQTGTQFSVVMVVVKCRYELVTQADENPNYHTITAHVEP